MQYAVLAQRSPELEPELIAKIRLLYEGGYKLLRNAKTLLARVPNEPPAYFNHRVKCASYMPYLGQLVDYLVGSLFQAELQVTPAGDANDAESVGELPDKNFYPLFARDADRCGTTFSQLIRDAVTEALLCRYAWIAVDLPVGTPAITRRDEEEAGSDRAYCYLVPYEQVFDFQEDDDGELQWIVLCKRIARRNSPLDTRTTYVDRFTVWTIDDAPGAKAVCEVFETPPVKLGDEPNATQELIAVSRLATSFSCIPIVKLELPYGLWAGNKIAPLAEEHFRRRSDLVGAMAKSLVEIPYVKQGPEIPEQGGPIVAAAEDPHRGQDPVMQFKNKGFLVLGEKDELGFAGPSGKGYEIADKSLSDLRDEIFRSVHAMALSLANTAAAVKRSGDSKREDRQATEVVLSYLGKLAREFAVRVYTEVSEVRGEDVVWTAHGLDSYDLDDIADTIEQSKGIAAMAIPSKTFQIEYKTRFAMAVLPSISPETKAQIQQEIADGTSDPAEDAAAERAAAAALFGQQAGAERPSAASTSSSVRAGGDSGRPQVGKNNAGSQASA